MSDDIKSKIKIIPELRDLIPPLSQEDRNQLRENISSEGKVREAIILWENQGEYILVDGHNRYSIISELNISTDNWKVDIRKFDDMQAVRTWMLNNQLGRRNLTPSQASYLRGQLYNQFKKNEGAQSGNANAKKQISQNDQVVSNPSIEDKNQLSQNDQVVSKPSLSTAQLLAQQTKVSPKTIQRDALYAKGIDDIGSNDPGLKKEILAGDSKIKKSDIQAIGQGKKSVDDIVVGTSHAMSASSDLSTPASSNPSVTVDADTQYTEAQTKKLDTAKTKINTIFTQLLKAGISKKDIRSLVSEELKNN